MKKLLEFWDNAAEWLCGFSSDKWVHFVVGAIISFLVAWILMATTAGATELGSAFCGAFGALIAGMGKEVADIFCNKDFSLSDVIFTAVGGVFGGILFML